MIGVVAPATQLAVAGSRNGADRPARDAGDGRERRLRARGRARPTPTSHLESVACPDLAPIIQGGFPFDEHVVETVRGYCAPLREAEVDTVILGCTHYPLVAPMLQRMLGRGVALVTSGRRRGAQRRARARSRGC